MNPSRVDFLVDLAYGALIFVAVAIIFAGENSVGIAFGLGALVAYVIHIAWKMGRFDPDWMTREMAQRVEETVHDEVEETVSKEVDRVEESVSEEVEKTVEETVSKEVDDVAEQVGETVSEEVTEKVEETVSEEVEKSVSKATDEE
jgi:preprotein translocase subunit SecF